MTKRWSLAMLCGIVVLAGIGRSGRVRSARAAAGERIVVTSANDPTKPVPGGVRWFWRMHNDYLQQTKNRRFNLCFLGDSITQMWPRDLFGKYYGKYNVVNFGIGGDRTENVLFRLHNGELKGTSPKVIVLLIGTNNSGMNTAPEIALGVMTVVKTLRTMLPRTKILLLGVFPKRDMTLEKTRAINAFLVKLDDRRMIRYLDAGAKLLDKDDKILGGVLRDAVHPTRRGFEIWAEAMNPLLAEMMTKRAAPDNAKRSSWNGYEMLQFSVGGRSALLVVPKKALPGNPWIWRTEFFGVAPQADIALLGKGVHVAYISIGGLFGAPVALDAMDEYYAYVTRTYGLSTKTVLEGFSRGGLYAFNWAARHPDRVACMYVDAPVCDFKSWPGGQGRARHSGRDWRQLLSAYRMNDKQALAYKLNPVDNLAPLAKAKIPILSVIGDMHDWIVPINENTLVVEKRYKALGGEIQVIRKPKAGHRPHSLPDPTPIVEFVLKHVSKSGRRTTAGLPREVPKTSRDAGAARAAARGKVATEAERRRTAEAIAQGLVAHWKFDDGRGATARDSSGKRNHGSIVGARWAKGRLGGALDFDGGDDYVSVPRALPVDFSRAFTVSLWVKLDSVSRFDPLIGVTQDSNNYAFCLCIEGGLRLYTKLGGGLDATNIHSTRVGPGVWYHFAAVMDASNNCTMYVNGMGETSRNITQRSNRGILHIARMANAGAWTEKIDGLIDDVRVYGRALSEEEVKFVFDGRPPLNAAKEAKTTSPAKKASATKKAKAVDTMSRTKATTFYVSQSSGNDSWTGQAASPKGNRGPWKTLARASTNYIPGDRILLKCGDTWNEELRPKGSGTPSKPIVISSYGKGKKPIIDRQDYNQDRIGIFLHDQGGIKIVGLEFARCMTGIYAEYPDNTSTKKYVWIEDCYFRDSLKYGNYKTYPTPRNIGLGICFFSYERDKRIVLEDIMIKNCVFRRLASAVWTNSPDNFNKGASFVYNFGNMNLEDCLFEEGYQWQQGIRGVDKGSMRNCVTVDIGRGFRAWNGVAGAMFFRCKDWVFEDCEWGFVSIGLGSGDGEAFDFEGNCNDMTMRNCLFHDTDGPCFLLCCYASDGHPNMGIVMENCVLNGKAKRPIGLPRCEIINTTDWNEVTWKKCRFYLSPGEALMRVMDPEKEKRSTFVDCSVKNLSEACSTPNLAARAKAKASSQEPGNQASRAIDRNAATSWKAASPSGQWLELDFRRRTTINEFRIKEDASSSVIRYVIQYWDDRKSRWAGCFNGRAIGPDFIAPIVSRTTRKVRLFITRTTGGNPCIREFEVYNDTTGRPHNVAATRRGK